MPVRRCYAFVYKEGEDTATPLAHLDFPDDEYCLVRYGKAYAQRNTLGLDPITLPCTPEALPIRWDQANSLRDAGPGPFAIKMLAQAGKLPGKDLTQADRLLCFLPARTGNLDFRTLPSDTSPPIDLPDFADLENIAHILDKTDFHDWRKAELNMVVRGLGTGGTRPNCTIHHEGSLWLAKFARNEEAPSAIASIHALLCLADQCGIDVASTKRFSFAKRDCLLQERFDRERLESGFGRSGYFSAFSLLSSVRKNGQGIGCLALADQMRRICPEYLQEFFNRVLFSLILDCSDNLLDNTGFLHSSGLVRLAPAFAFAVPQASPTLQRLSGKSVFSAQLSSLLDSSARFGITKEQAKHFLSELLAPLSHWQDTFATCAVPKEATTIIGQHIEIHLGQAQEILLSNA